MAREMSLLQGPLAWLEEKLGPVEGISPVLPFSYTDYYTPEMGKDLVKRFLALRHLWPAGDLPKIKAMTWDLEKKTSVDGRRTINLDPGLLTPEKLVLATGKDAGHRIYIGDGVFGDLHLLYQKGSYKPLPWTYPDYREEWIIQWMNRQRERVMDQRREREE